MPFSSSGERHFSCGFLSAGILCSDFSTCDSRPYRAGCPGDLEIWRFGDLEIWRFGDFSCRSIPFAPLSVAGIPKPFRMEALCRTADFFRGLPEGEGNRVKNIWSGSEVKTTDRLVLDDIFAIFMAVRKNVAVPEAERGTPIAARRSVPLGCDVMAFFARTGDRTDRNRI